MRRAVFAIATVAIVAVAAFAFAHHAAEGIVDEEIYDMIETMIEDTPHASFLLEDLGSGMTAISVDTMTVRSVENIIDDGLLTYAAMLDGQVTVEIAFVTPRNVEMTIYQQE